MNARYFEIFTRMIGKLGSFFKLPFKFYLTFFPIPVNDYWLFTETKHMGIVPQVLTGSFERYATRILRKIIKPGWIIYDIGANIGYYTILFSKLTSRKGKVYSFEPDKDSFELLERNISLNACNNIFVQQLIISDKKGKAKLYISDNPSDHRIFNPKGEKRPFKIVSQDKLDNLAKKDEMINLVKIDVQGAEGKCLKGMKKIISKNKDMILFVEYWPDGLKEIGDNPVKILKDLSKMGFKIYSLDEYHDCATLILNYDKFNEEVFQKKDQNQKFMNLLCTKKNINMKNV